MSITSALSSALSGLAANSRAAGVVSANLANIQTEGYGRREIALSQDAVATGGGVRVSGIIRHVDSAVLSDRRAADSDLAQSQTRANFLKGVQASIGTPDSNGSLSSLMSALEASLVTAASRPEATDRLQQVSLRAAEVTGAFNDISDSIQNQRMRAEEQIEASVRGLNSDLEQVHRINIQIQIAQRKGADTSGLLDHRQVVVDRVAELIPIREVARDDGAIALMTPGGTLLVDSGSARLEFTRTNVIAPHMTLEGGLLSGLRINGEQVAPAGMRSPIEGGRLSAMFDVRDTLAVDAQRQIDALARDVIERFQDPAWDTTVGAADPGLFTDQGGRFDVTSETGIAGRMALNLAVDPTKGGDPQKLRDGLGAVALGPVGNAARLHGLADAFAARSSMASGDLGGAAGSASQHIASMVSQLSQTVLAEDRVSSFAAVRQSGLAEALAQDGVNSDDETARLLLIEQAYAANARMIQTLDEMMDTLLRIG
ncbi:flagellar hook-associated protein FlgK [Roseovarius nanhaiticus]|uniref:flagellar hook-associated protein FlgK n=1 Tax=Roseovarius nanhaiticus TaxID=573024 RepID=UPI0024925727|nr:flagellar hook-associated protein FlgK [Roseovarius nanhaiticus]